MRQTRKQAFNASQLVPIMCEEVLPGDVWQHKESIMARLATPIAPVVDDLDLETFYFFVPNRIVWPDWEDFITGNNTALTVPQIAPYDTVGADNELLPNSVLDHFGILPQTYTSSSTRFNVLPVWGYFTIFNQWFRDQNLQAEYSWPASWTWDTSNAITNGTPWNQQTLRINKRHDYFTSSLPWAQKGNPVTMPLGTTAPIIPSSSGAYPTFVEDASGAQRTIGTTNAAGGIQGFTTGSPYFPANGTAPGQRLAWQDAGLVADLSAATAATINSIRLAVTTQRLLELDARGGSRYVENLMAHWGVRAKDYRLQIPEYLGGSKISVTVNPIAQTAAYDAATGESPLGNLGAEMHASGHKKTFTYASEEHGYIIGLAVARATPTYQQGTRRHWRRQTRLDFPDPVFANIGEQAVATQEIFQPNNNTPSNAVWGYQERYAEMRYTPNEITGVFRSTNATPLDWWHYSEEFGTEPALNATFIEDKTQETLERSLATDSADQWSAQILMDILHDNTVARLLPTYGVPGLVRF
ncbi:MAG: major capsid protein [Arizlama microvirus]|nr:MAG: major capsid protein [Arizlama microvirus]